MNVFPFRRRKDHLDTIQNRTWQEDLILGGTAGLEVPTSTADDFLEEIEITRSNEMLMAVLLDRAKEPATASLKEVKRRVGIVEQ